MDYRKKYKKHYGEIPNDWDVHHIDFNRKNNQIENLVAIPIELHKKIHNINVFWLNTVIFSFDKPLPHSRLYEVKETVKLYIEIQWELTYYINIKGLL